MTTYKNVKLEMVRYKTTLFRLALELDLEPSFLSRCLNGKEKMPETMAIKLTEFFDIPREILFGDSKEYFKYVLSQLKKGQNLKHKEANTHKPETNSKT